ncbi:MAG: DUF2007 domain-containing protein [Tannerellaceae bacterium]|jgi:hypothetical protein|nr:DUF2007 domain-containing protein [Tannerellaceae bacterium]
MMDTTDKMVEIARFQYPTDARTLMALLQSEEIDCYLRNEYSTLVMAGYDVGGARVEILESDVPRALEVMKAGGYEIPEEDENPEQMQTVAGWVSRIPILRKLSLEKQVFVFLILIATCLGLLISLGSLFSA